MSYIWLCGSCMTWTRRERKNWNVDKMKKTSPPQKLQRRFSSTSICHRKWCSVISCHCLSSFTLLSGYFVWLYTYRSVNVIMSNGFCRYKIVFCTVQYGCEEHKPASLPHTYNSTICICINCFCICINCILFVSIVFVFVQISYCTSCPWRTQTSVSSSH